MGGYLWSQPPADAAPRQAAEPVGSPTELLEALLRIEKQCCPASSVALEAPTDGVDSGCTNGDGDLSIKVLLDEPDIRFCICHDLDSPVIIVCLWARLKGATVDDVIASLCQERAEWDAGGENLLLQKAEEEDEFEEEIYHSIIRCPRPFWDREVLKRQWRLPLQSPHGIGRALVSTSTEDAMVAKDASRVRAAVHKAGFLLRPSPQDSEQEMQPHMANGPVDSSALSTELTSCSQIDMGGLIPPWATTYLSSIVAGKASSWTRELQRHCNLRKGEDSPVPTLAEISAELSPGWAESWDETERPDSEEEEGTSLGSLINVRSLKSLSWSPF